MTICKSAGRVLAFRKPVKTYYDPEYEITTVDPKSSAETVRRFHESEGLDLPEFLARAVADAKEADTIRARASLPTAKGAIGPRLSPTVAGRSIPVVHNVRLERQIEALADWLAIICGTLALMWLSGALLSFLASVSS